MKQKYFLKFLFTGLLFFFSLCLSFGQVIISQYYEGASNNKWIEVTNVGSTTIDLTSPQLYLCLFANARADDPANSQANNNNAMSGSLNPGQVILYKNSSAVLPSYATGTSSSSCGFNGDDLIVISSSSTNSSGDVWGARLDVIGAGNSWGSNKAFYRNSNITSANTTYTTGEWTQVTYSAVDNAYNTASEYLGTHLYDAPVTSTTWTGGTDTDWATASNWDNGVPTSSLDATIPDVTNAPIISASTGAAVKDLTINESDGLTISSGGSIIVSGTSSGNITYNRTLATTNWYLISSPVEGQDIDTFVAAEGLASGTNGSNLGLSDYNNTTPGWEYYQNGASGTGSFTSGDGRSIKLASTGDVSFTGTINTSDVTVAMTSNSNGFNLVGNPYPSFIAANNSADGTNNILKANDTDNDYLTESTIWLWNQGTSSYNQINHASAAKYIAPGQGFFVSADGAYNFSITEAMQSHQSSDSFQRSNNNRPEINLTITNGTDERNTDIYYIEGTTTGWDNGYDSSIFGGVANEFAIYTHTVANGNGRDLGIQSLPNNEFENMIIPVGVNAEAGTAITIDAATNNFPTGINIYLEDKQDNSFTLLEADSNFSLTPENSLSGIGRFYLHTTSGVLSADDFDTNNNISIYTSSNDNLRIVGVQNGTATVRLYNILGKEMLKISFEGNGVNDINLNTIPMGIYIVKLTTENGVLNRKIIIQ
ncbi:T9SS type A sorting domain-containing protein [Flavobacteriaceae bacterium]|nr:T9SS type A sorting domain-containing protein [Flavobacteriaceae bacterium]